ncbi:hypothetical protein [Acinetobacter baumannii]|uniref:hypothetical protein n=1 Tax=Acinetobacter baumannii TaxID=470 RepID=UPI003B59F3B6
MSLIKQKIIITDVDGNERTVDALCLIYHSEKNLDDKIISTHKNVKLVEIDGYVVEVGIDGSFFHPETRVLYSV